MTETTKQRLLRQAADRIGRDTLASGLNVPPELLDAWLKGYATMPDRKFLALADLLDKISAPPAE